MEIVGGFMVMMSIISLFLAVVWLIMPFVVFAIKGKQDRTLEVLESIEKRLAALEALLQPAVTDQSGAGSAGTAAASAGSSDESAFEQPIKNAVISADVPFENNDPDASPAVQKTGGF
ncbi:MAG: hypothetical protein WC007_09800 [Pelobacteraceae bacterium]